MALLGFLLPTLWDNLSAVKAVLVLSSHTPTWKSMSAVMAVLKLLSHTLWNCL